MDGQTRSPGQSLEAKLQITNHYQATYILHLRYMKLWQIALVIWSYWDSKRFILDLLKVFPYCVSVS